MRGKQIHTPIWVAGSVLVVMLVVGGVAGGALTVRHGNVAFAAPVSVSAASSEQARIGETFAPIVQTDAPAIVNISSSRKVSTPNLEPFAQDPFFRRFFGEQSPDLFRAPRERVERSLGSGVIVSADGYVLTNNHVVENAQDIKVGLNDTREFAGRVVGTDPKTDLAVVKINQSGLHP